MTRLRARATAALCVGTGGEVSPCMVADGSIWESVWGDGRKKRGVPKLPRALQIDQCVGGGGLLLLLRLVMLVDAYWGV